MKTLETKIQYKNFEKGEFASIQQRTFEETKKLIQDFPWEEQRHLTPVWVTGPSVSIQRGDEYLKIGHYYNGKFRCYYLNQQRIMYVKGVKHMEEAISITEQFFAEENVNPSFKREYTHDVEKHFHTSDFKYYITRNSLISHHWLTNLFYTASVFVPVILWVLDEKTPNMDVAIIFIPLWLIVMLPNALISYNYHRHSKNKAIQISKGNDLFKYGEIGSLQQYRKKTSIL